MNPDIVWFTSDLHFGHENVLLHDRRPFKTIQEHDECIIDNWNSLIKPKHTVYILGDFCFKSEKSPAWYLDRLNGKKHLIVGNHDDDNVLNYPEEFESIQDILYIRLFKQKLFMCHYAMRTWRGSNKSTWMLHGHSHHALRPYPGSLDVGINGWDYKPINFSTIKNRLQGFKGISHHDPNVDNFIT